MKCVPFPVVYINLCSKYDTQSYRYNLIQSHLLYKNVGSEGVGEGVDEFAPSPLSKTMLRCYDVISSSSTIFEVSEFMKSFKN